MLYPEPNEAARDENLHHERAIIEHPRKLDARQTKESWIASV